MTTPATFMDAPTLMGSWPIAPSINLGGTPSILPRTLLYRARIMGMAKETGAGYDVSGRSFFLDVDSGSYSVSFTGSGALTLQEVIDQINAAPGIPTVAYRDNGFLRLESPTSGAGSYLQIRTDPSSSPTDVLGTLGLFAGLESRAADLASPPTTEPERQLVSHRQLSFAEGESLTSEAINRIAMQLSVNSDQQYGLLARKRLGKSIEISKTDPGSGFVLFDSVYTGAVMGPSAAQLEDVVAVLDEDGNEVLVDVVTVLGGSLSLELWYDPTLNAQVVYCAAGPFLVSDMSGPIFVRSTSGSMGALSGVPLKILNILDATTVYVLNEDPATGIRYNIGTPGSHETATGNRIQVVPTHVQATGLWTNSGMTSRVEQISFPIMGLRAITRIDLNNRVVCAGAGFTILGVSPGDRVTISGHTVSDPYSNDGAYRVGRVIDDETLELVNSEFGPVFLNPTGGLGDVRVDTDGVFYTNPYVSLSPTVPAGDYKIVYRQNSTLRDIMEDAGALTYPPAAYRQSNDALIERTLRSIIGPSVNSFYEYLHDDHRISLDSLEYRMDIEHDEVGRHTEIWPDFVIAHNKSYEDWDSNVFKWRGEDSDGNVLSAITASGWFSTFDPVTGNYAHLSQGMLNLFTSAYGSYIFMESEGGNQCLIQLDADSDSNSSLVLRSTRNSVDAASKVTYTSFRNNPLPSLWWSYDLGTITSKVGVLSLDVVRGSTGSTFDSLTTWVSDADGTAVGFGGTTDPCYRSDSAARTGMVEVISTTEWPLWIRGQNGTAANRNSLLFAREVGVGGVVTSGAILGCVDFGGRYGTNRGNIAMGYNGGAEIMAIANENWGATARGAYLQFRTTTATHDHADLRASLSDTGLVVYGNGGFNYNGGATTFDVGNTTSSGSYAGVRGTGVGAGSASEFRLGDESVPNRYVFSCRGDAEGSTYHDFRLLYRTATTYKDVLKTQPFGSVGGETYYQIFHDGNFYIDANGKAKFVDSFVLLNPSAQLHVESATYNALYARTTGNSLRPLTLSNGAASPEKGSFNPGTQATPSSPSYGDFYLHYPTVKLAFWDSYDWNRIRGCVHQLVSDITISAASGTFSGEGQHTFPASQLRAGTTIKIRISGYTSGTPSGATYLTINFGGQSIQLDNGSTTAPSWDAEYCITIRTDGSSGTFAMGALVNFSNGIARAGNVTGSINTTVSNTVTFSISATASTSHTLRQLVIDAN